MVRKNYTGLVNPRERLLALAPARTDLLDMSRHYRPTSPEYRALRDAIEAIDRLGSALAHEPNLYRAGLHRAG